LKNHRLRLGDLKNLVKSGRRFCRLGWAREPQRSRDQNNPMQTRRAWGIRFPAFSHHSWRRRKFPIPNVGVRFAHPNLQPVRYQPLCLSPNRSQSKGVAPTTVEPKTGYFPAS